MVTALYQLQFIQDPEPTGAVDDLKNPPSFVVTRTLLMGSIGITRKRLTGAMPHCLAPRWLISVIVFLCLSFAAFVKLREEVGVLDVRALF